MSSTTRPGAASRFAFAALALVLLAPSAAAVWTIEQPLPIGLRVGSGTSGEISYSIYENNDHILFGGFTTGGTTSQWSFNVDGQIFTSASGPGATTNPSHNIDPINATQSWTILGVKFTLNATGVNNSTLLVMTASSDDGQPHDVGFRYMWDILLTGGDQPDGPEIMIAGEPGDTPGFPGCYSQREADFALPEFPLVKMWKSCTGPDDHLATKAYLVWDPALGGNTPDRFTIASWGASFGTANSWHFQVDPNRGNLQFDNSVITWWGYYDPLRISATNSSENVFWYGRDIPPALATYFVNAFFNDRASPLPPDHVPSLADLTRLRFVEAGSTTFYPIRVINNGGLRGQDPNTAPPTIFDVALEGDAPPGWGYSLVEANSQAPIDGLALRAGEARDLRIKVVAPLECGEPGADPVDCALGNDAARVNVTISYHDKPTGYYNKLRSKLSSALFTTTIVKPHYSLDLQADGELVEIAPGGTASYNLTVTNTGNLREPLPVELGLNTILNPGWQAQYTPARLALTHGETQAVQLKITVPTNEPGNDHVLTARAGVSGKTDFDTAEVNLRVIADRIIRLDTPQPQLTVPPGGTVVFPITVTNEGVQGVPMLLNLTMEQASKSAGWKAELRNPGFPSILAAGRSANAMVELTAPKDIQAGERSSLLFSARMPDGDVLNSLSLAGIAGATPNAELENRDGISVVAPGSILNGQIAVRNTGNRVETLRLLAATLPAGWTVEVTPESTVLAPGEEALYDVRVTVPADARAGTFPLGFRVVDRDSLTQQAITRAITVTTIRQSDLDVDERTVRVLPEGPFQLVVTIANEGNSEDRFTPTGLPDGWLKGSSLATPWLLDAGESRQVRLALQAPDAIDTYDLSLGLRSESDGTQSTPDADARTRVYVSRPDLGLQGLQVLGGADIEVAQVVTLQARVTNSGDVGARDFAVRLIVDGEPADTAYSIAFIEAADDAGNPSSALVSMAWVPNAPGPHELQLVADHEQVVREIRRDNNVVATRVEVAEADAPVQALDKLDFDANPAPALPWALVALSLLAVARRRTA